MVVCEWGTTRYRKTAYVWLVLSHGHSGEEVWQQWFWAAQGNWEGPY